MCLYSWVVNTVLYYKLCINQDFLFSIRDNVFMIRYGEMLTEFQALKGKSLLYLYTTTSTMYFFQISVCCKGNSMYRIRELMIFAFQIPHACRIAEAVRYSDLHISKDFYCALSTACVDCCE